MQLNISGFDFSKYAEPEHCKNAAVPLGCLKFDHFGENFFTLP